MKALKPRIQSQGHWSFFFLVETVCICQPTEYKDNQLNKSTCVLYNHPRTGIQLYKKQPKLSRLFYQTTCTDFQKTSKIVQSVGES
jgi:hypothetical protein